MILLDPDHLLFQTTGGELIPCSAEDVSIELLGDSAGLVEPEHIKNAAAAVLHYFKHDLGKDAVSVGEFSLALEHVLRGFGFTVKSADLSNGSTRVAETDLRLLAGDTDTGCELLFFPALRNALRIQLKKSPRLLRFRGLRPCVKKLIGARRWCARCQTLEDQIVEYLRTCLLTDRPRQDCSLIVH